MIVKHEEWSRERVIKELDRHNGWAHTRNWYYKVPEVTDKGFYREVTSLTYFFHGVRERNLSPLFLYHLQDRTEFENHYARMCEDFPDWPLHEPTPVRIASLWDFYTLVGYDYKRQKWNTVMAKESATKK